MKLSLPNSSLCTLPVRRDFCTKVRVRGEYHQDYSIRNKETLQEQKRLWNLDYYLRNKDAAGEKKTQRSRDYYARKRDALNETRKGYRRQYDVRNKEARENYERAYSTRHVDSMKQRRQRRYLDNLPLNASYNPRVNAIKSWKTVEHVRSYFNSIAPQLLICHFTDWYRISRVQIIELGGKSLFSKFESLGTALQYAYPEYNWEIDRFSHKGKKSGQRWLKLKIAKILPGLEINEEFLHPELMWGAFDCACSLLSYTEDESQRRMEFDIWIPKYQIGIEYQGEQHYNNKSDAFGPNGSTVLFSERDLTKQAFCNSLGITLIGIPYWWDGEIDTLSATLYQARPDVFPPCDSKPIPGELPTSFIEANAIRSEIE